MTIEEILVVQDIAIVVLVAIGMAILFRWIHQPLLIGYIVAGMLIGPYTPPFSLIHCPDVLSALAEMGIVFLLFAVGMEYPMSRLRAVGRKALVVALSEWPVALDRHSDARQRQPLILRALIRVSGSKRSNNR